MNANQMTYLEERLAQIDLNIRNNNKTKSEFENKRDLSDNPAEKKRCQQEIDIINERITLYETDFKELKTKIEEQKLKELENLTFLIESKLKEHREIDKNLIYLNEQENIIKNEIAEFKKKLQKIKTEYQKIDIDKTENLNALKQLESDCNVNELKLNRILENIKRRNLELNELGIKINKENENYFSSINKFRDEQVKQNGEFLKFEQKRIEISRNIKILEDENSEKENINKDLETKILENQNKLNAIEIAIKENNEYIRLWTKKAFF